ALREALAIEPVGDAATECRRLLVEADRAHGKGDGLRRSLGELAAHDPDPAVARASRLELARIEEKEQRPADAIKVHEEQLAVTPGDGEALTSAARLLAALGNPLEAVTKLEAGSRAVESADAAKAAAFSREAARILEKEARTGSQAPAEGVGWEVRAREAW